MHNFKLNKTEVTYDLLNEGQADNKNKTKFRLACFLLVLPDLRFLQVLIWQHFFWQFFQQFRQPFVFLGSINLCILQDSTNDGSCNVHESLSCEIGCNKKCE